MGIYLRFTEFHMAAETTTTTTLFTLSNGTRTKTKSIEPANCFTALQIVALSLVTRVGDASSEWRETKRRLTTLHTLQDQGFMLADAGYDVWLGNIRGNFYGRRHVRLSPQDDEFWDYSWNEVARYDVPAMLEYIRQVTNVDRLSYVGHSMGASLLFAAIHYQPHINSWLTGIAAMAPAAYMHNKMGPHRILSVFINELSKGLHESGVHDILPLTRSSVEWSGICSEAVILSPFCTFIHFIINGPNSNYVDKKYLPVIYAHTPAGTGLRIFTQLLQIVDAQKFQAFDYGSAARNQREYGQSTPPPYLLSRVTAPVGIFWSDNDWVVDPKDIAITASELPNVVMNYRVPVHDFNHVDFMWAEIAGELVYNPVIKFLKSI